ncbi:hypothetical protein [Vibrio sp. HN007]|uniref:hypothetical protein n=1 Tax=Vibrio iocasae TaxID=3098914 RepID=UPI0035D468C4
MNQKYDDQDIISLYKKGATETPSAEADNAILEYSVSNLKKSRNWWPYIGLAASVGFVAILAPWQWQEEPLSVPVPEQVEAFSDEMSLMGVAPEAERAIRAKSSRQLSISPFTHIERLLQEDRVDEARSELQELLKAHPELEKELPEHLLVLLEE